MTTDDPYFVLGVARDCSPDELKAAYRRLARDNHPDVARDKAIANLRMTQINAAWSQVGDPQKRSAFDARWRLDERDRQSAHTRFARQAAPTSKPASASSQTRPTRASPSPKPAATRANTSKSGAAPSSEGIKPHPKRPLSSSSLASRRARLDEASRLLFKQNKPNEALELCKAILKTDFRNIPARELMGEAYLRLGQTDRALAVWEQALVLSPSNVTLRRRWLGLMPPEVRAAHERKVPQPRPPVATNLPRPNVSPAKPNLLSRLVEKLRGR